MSMLGSSSRCGCSTPGRRRCSVTAVETAQGGGGVSSEAIQVLASSMRGPVVRPADPEYDAARRVWNGNIDRRPALIARCTGVADVVAAVNFARENGLLVPVRGGPHSAARP